MILENDFLILKNDFLASKWSDIEGGFYTSWHISRYNWSH